MTWPLSQPDEIAERLATRVQLAFPDAEDLDPRAPDTMIGVLLRAFAMEAFDALLYQRYLAEQLMPDTATGWLERHADLWGVPRIAATNASRTVTFTGANGTVIPFGATMRSPAGVTYRVLGAVTVASGTATVAVYAETPGVVGNASIGTTLTLVNPIAGLAPQSGTVAAVLGNGAEAEEIEAWRARVLARIRQPPMGGAAADYVDWAKAVSSDVAQVAVLPGHVGPGTVGVVIAMAGGVAPSSGQLAAIAEAIEEDRPVTAAVTVLACEPLAVAHSIQISPDTSAVRTAVTSALDAFYAREAAIGGVLPLSRISEAISSASGEYSHVLVAPAADVTPTALQLPTRGAITWVTP